MSERARNVFTGTISFAALLVMVVGLWPQAEATTDPSERSDAIAARLKCPFCAGESLADAQSGVARDLRTLIDERVASGASDAEVIDEFVDRYGEQILLDPPRTGWGVGLWLVPLLIAGLGVWAILGLRRRKVTSGEPVETEREDATP
jgi:cytochrome c-type biogenesis protein CcmH